MSRNRGFLQGQAKTAHGATWTDPCMTGPMVELAKTQRIVSRHPGLCSADAPQERVVLIGGQP
jgi:hypothetical protein